MVCFAFSISPQPFVNQMNRATSEAQKDSADEEGLPPFLNWIKRLCDHVIQRLLGAPQATISFSAAMSFSVCSAVPMVMRK